MRHHGLLAPLLPAHAELVAKQARHRALAGADGGRAFGQRGPVGRVAQQRLAQLAQALVGGQRHVDADLRGALDLVDQQRRDHALALRRLRVGRRQAVGRGVERQHQGAQQRADLEHLAFLPGGAIQACR
jgi:hypothetical protein